MNWVPVVFVTFKIVVFSIGMFFAVKWHYDQETEKREVLRAAGKVAVVFVLLLPGLMFVAFALARMLV
jgi:hypothetical protein